MAPEDFHFLARLVRRRSGLSLSMDKMALAQCRLLPVMRRFHFKDMDAMIGDLRSGRQALAEAVTQAMTINQSSFFRDQAVFGAFRQTVLPERVAARADQKRLRIWSAACAAGQEAYSIAIILAQTGLARAGWRLEILASDISADMICRAENGRYAAHEIQRGLDEATQARYFHRDGTKWAVAENLRRMVSFHRFNLLDSFGWLDDVDVVFCCNVLMYFDTATRAEVLARLADTLAPDGILFVGENEVPEGTGFRPRPHSPSVYAKSPRALARAS